MAKIKVILLSIVLVAVLPFSALAGSYVKLGGAKKASSIQLLGKASVKKSSPLQLGKLRTNEAKLPAGKLTLTGRMKLRAKRALQRQNALSRTRAKRRPAQAKRPASAEEVSDQDYSDINMRPNSTPVIE